MVKPASAALFKSVAAYILRDKESEEEVRKEKKAKGQGQWIRGRWERQEDGKIKVDQTQVYSRASRLACMAFLEFFEEDDSGNWREQLEEILLRYPGMYEEGGGCNSERGVSCINARRLRHNYKNLAPPERRLRED